MSKVSFPSLFFACATLAACSGSETNRTVTAPDVGPAFNETTAGIGFGSTADGLFDVYFDGAPLSQFAAQAAAAAQSATGGRASGHVDFNFAAPTLGLTSERYSFNALSTGPAAALGAKGQFELMLTAATGVVQKVHGELACMNTVGNITRMAGLITKVWVNNVQRPITGATHTIWTVQDNGEGQGTVDTASPMFFNNATNALTHCTVGFTPPQFAVAQGEVQVRP